MRLPTDNRPKPTSTNPPNLSLSANMGSSGARSAGGPSRADAALVEIVKVDDTVLVPGVAEEGENEQEARLGRFEHASEMELLKAPFCG